MLRPPKYCFKKSHLALAAAAADAIGAKVYPRSWKRCGALPLPSGQRILIVRLDHIGDVLLSTPAIRALRESLQPKQLDALVGPWSSELLRGNPAVDKVLVYAAPWHARRPPHKTSGAFLRTVRGLNKRRYDVGIDLRGDVRSILLMTLSGIPCRVGYGITGGGFLLSHEMPYPMESRYDVHEIDRNLAVAERLSGQSARVRWPHVSICSESQTQAERLMHKHALDRARKVLIVHVGAGYPSKRWPIERFIEVARRVKEGHPEAVVVLTGSSEERALGAYCDAALPRCHNLVGATSLGGLSALLRELASRAGFVGADSGPMHIAWCVGMPVVALFSATDSAERWRPRGRAVVIQRDVPCKHCEKLSCGDHRCMLDITVEEVYAAVEHMWP